ncbi:MAG: hypothetical protein ACOYMR_10875 [Ilumatobacteraceae bacterium]
MEVSELMGQVRHALRSTSVRVLGAALLLLGVFTVTPLLSGAASAHKASIEAEVSCDGTVSWTATSWSKDESGANDDVRVHRRGGDGSDQEVGHGDFSGGNGYTFEGHFSWPAGESMLVVSTDPKGEWGNGESPDEEGKDEVELTKPDCEDDVKVDHELQCDDSAPGYGDGEVTLTLTNPAGPWGDDAEFDVYQPDDESAHETYAVPAGETRTVTYQGLSEGQHHIKVTEGEDDHSRDIEIDCDQQVPSVTASQACVAGDGSITVNLANTGGEAVTFEVKDPVTHSVEQVEVAPNSSASRTFAGLADGKYTVGVMVGETDLSQYFEVDCDKVQEPPHENECPTPSTSTTVDEYETSTSEEHASTSEAHTSTSEQHTSSSVKYTTTSEKSTSTSEKATTTSMKSTSTSVKSTSTSVKSTSTSVKSTSTSEKAASTSVKSTSSSAGYQRSMNTTTSEGAYSTSTSVKDDEHATSTSADEASSTSYEATSTTVDEEEKPCEPKGEGSIEVAKVCVANDGQVTVTLIATGGQVTFTVEGSTYVVQPGNPRQVVVAGLSDGTHTIHVMAGYQDLSFTVDIACDLSPRVTVSQECVGFDGSVRFLLENLGDDNDATFTIAGEQHVVAPGASTTVVIDGLVDGPHTFTVAINGVAMPDVTVTVDCNPTFDVVAQCNAVAIDGGVQVYWFTITNTEATDVQVSWNGGSATVPAGASRTVGSLSAPLQVSVGGEVVASAPATDVVCSRTVTVGKELIGGPAAPETYSVRISRLVGGTYVEVTTVPLVAGQPTSVTLPSTLDPAGVQYRIEEVDRGTAATSVVSPSQLTLSGHLGETVSVVVTNGYASVQIDKTVSAAQVGLGDNLTYTLQGRNTGGLTLDQVVVTDRLPAGVAYVSATLTGGTCSLTESARPQLFTCQVDGSLVAGASTPVITVVVTVDNDAALVGRNLVNQGKIVGAYATPASSAPQPTPGAALSCEPVVDGTVCDLSASVSTSVVGTEPPGPTPPPTTTVPGSTTTVPGSTTTVPDGSTTTVPDGSTTTLPDGSTTTLPDGSTTTTTPDNSTTSTVDVLPPVPTTTTPTPVPPTSNPSPLPRSGSNPMPLILLALGALGIGGVMMLGRRRV